MTNKLPKKAYGYQFNLVIINLNPHDLRRHTATYASRSVAPIAIIYLSGTGLEPVPDKHLNWYSSQLESLDYFTWIVVRLRGNDKISRRLKRMRKTVGLI